MILRFKSIMDEELTNNANVVFIFGDKPLFNNIISDRCRKKCENRQDEFETSLLEEFSTEYKGRSSLNKIEITQFKDVCYMPSLAGTWYCKVNLEDLNEKDTAWLKKYIKNPSDNAMLVIECTKYKVYRSWIKNRVIEYSKKVHSYQLSFPTKKELEAIVYDMFREKRIILDEEAVPLFIRKMGGRYDLYSETIDKIVGTNEREKVENWNLDILKGLMSNIQHYNLDMLVHEILRGTTAKKPSSRAKVMKLLKYLEDEHGCITLVNKIDSELDELIKYRRWINSGMIPVGIKYPTSEIKDRIDKDINIVTFKKRVSMASRVSLRDMIYIKLIISKLRYNPERCLFVIACRYTFDKDKIKELIA